MAPTNLAILRYLIPALILLPVTARVGLWPARVPRRLLVAMIVGAGLPFGLVAMAGSRFAPAAHMGVLMAGASPLFASALAWFRSSGLTAWQSAALVNTWATVLLLPWLLWRGATPFQGLPLRDVVMQAAMQGLVAGLLGLWTYSVAIARLGAARAASFGALAPVVSALGGYAWLGEPLAPLDGIAVACAVLGVAIASGSWRSARPAA